MTSLMHQTIVDVLAQKAQDQSDDVAFVFVSRDKKEHKISYQSLYEKSLNLASHLQGSLGERALIFLPSGLEYIIAFMGCLLAGVVAVPAYPPSQNKHSGGVQWRS